MRPPRYDSAQSVAAAPRSTLVVIGNFDGVHLGHRAVLTAAARRAQELGLDPLLLTFHPHPAVVLRGVESAVLTTMDRRVELVRRVAPELSVVVEPFTTDLSRLSAREFAERLLCSQLGAREVVVGANFRFGWGREGDVSRLAELGAELGFAARPQTLEGDATGSYSSSRVRDAIAQGNMAEAERVLGRPHALSGDVVAGDARGRSLGFPTANLGCVPELLPPHGVYACLVDRLEADARTTQLGLAVLNVGVRPTMGAGLAVEAHVLDFEGDLYGARLRVHLVARLREERAFPGLDALVGQIRHDIAAARRALADRRPDPAARGGWH